MATPTRPVATPTDPTALLVRDWVAADAAACAAIYAPYVLGSSISFELRAPDAAETAQRFLKHQHDGFPVLVAHLQESVLGYAYATAFRAREAYRGTVEHSVYVDQAAHGGGIGRLLMQHLIAACSARGFRQMVAVIGDSANLASQAFHRRLGFVEAGVLRGVGRKFDRDLDIVLMQRALVAQAP
jgi:L-amino acid N-acyltransferase YncA